MKSEPSMEQILASIRKIMAEEAAAQPSEAFALKKDETTNDTDILELTQLVEDPPEKSSENPAVSVSGGLTETSTSSSAAAFSEFDQSLAPQPEVSLTDLQSNDFKDSNDLSLGDNSFSLPSQTNRAHSESFPKNALSPNETGPQDKSAFLNPEPSLLSETAKHAGVSAIQQLLQVSENLKEPEKQTDPLKGRTVDAIMEDLLRPLLSHWLNENLPTLVEKIVKEEIRKLIERV